VGWLLAGIFPQNIGPAGFLCVKAEQVVWGIPLGLFTRAPSPLWRSEVVSYFKYNWVLRESWKPPNLDRKESKYDFLRSKQECQPLNHEVQSRDCLRCQYCCPKRMVRVNCMGTVSIPKHTCISPTQTSSQDRCRNGTREVWASTTQQMMK
jgi:hypothetical protein